VVFVIGAKIFIEPVLDFILLATVFQVIQFVRVGVSLGYVHKRLDHGTL